jgi:uncharacterized protein YbgA (DUF1722 family)/uncharacterized protein YbbK (DUF523 family)
MENIILGKNMKIGISSCLDGNKCRYDGAGSKNDFVVDVIKKYFDTVSYCPEDKVFGTPRETIRLCEYDNVVKVMTNKEYQDITATLQESCDYFAEKIANDNLCGFILKSKSPTCGMERVKIYAKDTSFNEKKGVGLFAKRLLELYPYLPIEEEGRLSDAWLRENFLMQVFAYSNLHEFLDNNPTMGDLVQFHSEYKYLIYSKSQEQYKILGNIVANHEKYETEYVLEKYKIEFLKSIQIKSTKNKTYNVLLHIFGYFKKELTKGEKANILETLEDFKNGLVPLIVIIKIFELYVDKFNIDYLKQQVFLNPYPKQLALRSKLEAVK